MNSDFDYNNAMASLYPDTEYIINKSAYDCGYEDVKEEIVRCRDCRYYDRIEVGCDFFGSAFESVEDENGFCKWGEGR